jgi:hypothetical protein
VTSAPPYKILFDELKSLIDDTKNRELECREFLRYIPHFLFKQTVIDYVYYEKEYRGHSGISDYVISAKVREDNGIDCVKAYIWELKAPQCPIFEKENENRLHPSTELIQAENQLLHYYYENKGSEQFRDEFEVTHPENVRFGGIIIGCNKMLVKGQFENESKRDKLYEKAMRIRGRYFYDYHGIRIITWDAILDQFVPATTHPIQHLTQSNTPVQIPQMPKDIIIGQAG